MARVRLSTFFPVLPASAVVKTGRLRMPKADLPLVIYDQKPRRGFETKIKISAWTIVNQRAQICHTFAGLAAALLLSPALSKSLDDGHQHRMEH